MFNRIWGSLSLATIFLLTVSEANDKCGCNLPYKRIGCFKDLKNDRALPDYILSERDKSADGYNGIMIEWHNWNNYMPGLICRCATKAKELGHSFFGVQFYGECWSGPDDLTSVSYKKHGESESCIGKSYAPCETNERNCVGSKWTNAVFQIVDTECDLKFERLGCYGDKPVPNRVISDFVISDRQRNLAVSSGQVIDWRNWEVYLPELVCRCAKKTQSEGNTVFGMQYYGECWTSADAEEKYQMEGERTSCVNDCNEQCHEYDPICIGKQWTNAVYRIVDPSGCKFKYEPIGCFVEGNNADDRLMTKELVNQVDPSSQAFNGHFLLQGDWNEELPTLLCRCAWKAAEMGYTGFSLHNQGECWSDPDFSDKYSLFGSSNDCVTDFDSICQGSNCAGGSSSSFVYMLRDSGTDSKVTK